MNNLPLLLGEWMPSGGYKRHQLYYKSVFHFRDRCLWSLDWLSVPNACAYINLGNDDLHKLLIRLFWFATTNWLSAKLNEIRVLFTYESCYDEHSCHNMFDIVICEMERNRDTWFVLTIISMVKFTAFSSTYRYCEQLSTTGHRC